MLIVWKHLQHSAIACASEALTSPAAMQVTHGAAQLFEALRFGSLAPPLVQPATAAEECRAVMCYLQLTLGLVAPALYYATTEARLFLQHAERRQRLGLPPERGWHPWLCRRIAGALLGLDWPFVVLLSLMLMTLLHPVAVAMAVASQQ